MNLGPVSVIEKWLLGNLISRVYMGLQMIIRPFVMQKFLLTFAEAHLMTTGYDDQVRFALNQLRDRCGMPDVPESLGTQEAIDFCEMKDALS